MTPTIVSSIAIIVFAALIHASFQISVSVLTLLSGHSLGRKTAYRRVMGLLNSFITGVFILTATFISALAYYFMMTIQGSVATEQLIAAIVSGVLGGIGIATLIFYYRSGSGTSLWLPRGLAHYLTKRTKVTKNRSEAFTLGLASVVVELIFIIAPMSAAALAIVTLPTVWWQLAGIFGYTAISLSSLLIIFFLVGGGHRISKLQAWRENNKRFLQFASGGSLIILAAYIFVDRLLGVSMYGGF